MPIAARARLLVLGGTGHIGCAIAREGVSRGYEVAVLSRRAGVSANLAGVDVTLVRGDVEDRQVLRASMAEVDLVIDAAAPYPLHPEPGVVERARARMRGVVRAVAESGARFAYVGSFVTLPRSRDAVSRLVRATHPYFAVKAAMEEVVLAACAHGLRALLVNPSACLGPWDPKPSELAFIPMLLNRELPMLVSTWTNLIDVRDLASELFDALEAERFGQPIALRGHDIQTDELARRICAIAGVPAPRARVPEGLALAGAMWSEAAFGLVGQRSPVPALGMMLLHESGAGLGAGFGVAGRRPLDETLRDAITWYRRDRTVGA